MHTVEMQAIPAVKKKLHALNLDSHTISHFWIKYVFFVLIVKIVVKNEKLHFAPNLCGIPKNW